MAIHNALTFATLFLALWSVDACTFPEDEFHNLFEPQTEQPCGQASLQGGHESLEQCLNINLRNMTKVYRGDEAFYESARCWNDRPGVIPYPSAIVWPNTVEQVALSILCAGAYEKMACARCGKHGAECSSGCDGGGVIINMENFDQVDVDLSTKTVAAGGGATLGMIYYQLYQEDMWTSLGFVGSVGIGLILGGGRGPNHRLYGLSADQIVEVEYVDWRGRNRVANKVTDTDVYWLVRGGGGGIFPGVITKLTLKAYNLFDRMTSYSFQFPRESYADVLEVWTNNQRDLNRRVETRIVVWGAGVDFAANVNMYGRVYAGGINFVLDEFATITDELAERGWNYTLTYEEDVDWYDEIRAESGVEDLNDRNSGYGTDQYQASTARKTASAMGYEPISYEEGLVLDEYINDPDLVAQATPYAMYHAYYSMTGAAQDLPPSATAYVHRQAEYVIEWTFQWSEQNVEEEALYERVRERRLEAAINAVTDAERRAAGQLAGSYFNYRDYDIPNAPTPREQLEDYFGENLDRILDIRCERDPKDVFGIPGLPLGCDAPRAAC